MSNSSRTPGIAGGRLPAEAYASGFADLHAPLDAHEARVAADRCYFCYDAPCTTACPTEIDIPLFIRQIANGQPKGAAETIFAQNILGGMCARVCPTETLCEEACVRETAEGKPVEIGRLQRYATDDMMAENHHPFARAAETGKHVAVVGAGPAGLACAHRLALNGHRVTLYDARHRPGGLNEYGIAAYKTTGGYAQAEVDWLLGIGGIEIRQDKKLGQGLSIERLMEDHDAVFLGIGLAGVNALAADGFALDGVRDAVDFIAELRQAADLATVEVGRRVVVIGGGMTAIDAGVQAKLLGAEEVTIVYRRGKGRMAASDYEQDLAASKGVLIRHNARPARVVAGTDGAASAVEFEFTEETKDGLAGTGEIVSIPADQVLVAIGQALEEDGLGAVALAGRKIQVDGEGRTSLKGVWAGGDCAIGGDDLTVTAVKEGRDAAMSIHRALSA